MTDARISAGSPCEKAESLYVEVAGTDIHPGHELVLEKDGELVSTLSMSQKPQHQLYECEYAVGDVERYQHTLTLNIEKEQGGAIRLPLLAEPRATRLSARIQSNLLFPVYPLAKLPRVAGDSGHALLRPGYLYVFWKGILWRELQNDENGRLRDIDLAHWRELAQGKDRGPLDDRPAVGVSVDTVWVPARFQQIVGAEWTVQDIEIAWSEVQWSWDYIESLESGHDLIHLPRYYSRLTGIPLSGKGLQDRPIAARRQARCTDLSSLRYYDYAERFGPESRPAGDWLPSSSVSPSRKRDPEREINAADPYGVTRHVESSGLGSEPDGLLRKIQQELEQLEGYTCKIHETVDFAKGLSNWVGDAFAEAGQGAASDGQSDFFSKQASDGAEEARRDLLNSVRDRLNNASAEEDQLAAIRGRNVAVVVITDVLFELAWLTNQSSLQLNHLSVMVESTQKHPHFKSAILLHSAVFDYKAYERGPFDDYKSDVDTQKLDDALRKSDRETARQSFYELIERRVRLLESGGARAVFNDLFALNGIEYLLGYSTLNQCLTHLDTSVFMFDRLAGKSAKSTEAYRDNRGAGYVERLAKGHAGLSSFVSVDPEKVPLDRALDTPAIDEFNDGSGEPRLALVQRLQKLSIETSAVPEALLEQYVISEKEKHEVVKHIAELGDATLTQWAQVSYTTVGQLVADLTSEFYLITQRTLLRKVSSGPIYKHADNLQIPTRLMKMGNPFMKGLSLTHANAFMINPNPDLVVLGMRFGTQSSGIGQLTDTAINSALDSTGGGGLVRPKGGVPNRIGEGMNANYALIRDQHGRMVANATSVAGYGGEMPKVTFQAELFTAQKGSVAARYSQGIRNRTVNAAMRWAPPGMLGLFNWNIVNSVEGLYRSVGEKRSGDAIKDATTMLYGVSNLLYWLGHIVEAENLCRQTRLSWLTKVRVDVDKISRRTLRSVARVIFTDQLLSVAKFAGVAGAALEVVLAVWQGMERLQANDVDAAVGYFTSAAGFLVFMFSHVAGTGVVPLLGITFAAALGILSLVVALGVLAWAIVRTDDALETWIKNGPFGQPGPGEDFGHLISVPDDSFQFLVGALFPINGESRALSHYEAHGLLSSEETAWLREEGRLDGQIISVSSAALLLMDEPEAQFKAHFWKHSNSYRNDEASISPDYVHYDPASYALRFHFPKMASVYVGREQIRERVRAKIQLSTSNGAVLPVSELDEPLKPAVVSPAFAGLSPRWYTV